MSSCYATPSKKELSTNGNRCTITIVLKLLVFLNNKNMRVFFRTVIVYKEDF